MSIEERVAALEERAGKPERPRKDIWDIVSVLGALMIPVALLVVGQQYTAAMQAAERSLQERAEANSLDVARAGSRVSQANLLLSALERLAGEDGPAKRVAIRAILLAMPEEGPGIIRDVARSDPSQAVRDYASVSLAERKLALIAQLYHPGGAERIDAYNALRRSWGADPTLPPLLADTARAALRDRDTPGRADGIYNTLVLLAHMEPRALAPHAADLRRLAGELRGVGPRVSERADTLIARLP